MTENQKLREALHKAKAALSLALSDVDWRKDSLTQPVIHKAYNCAHEALAMPPDVPETTFRGMREALQLIAWSNDSKWQADCARQALALPTADHLPDAGEMVVDHFPDATKMIETAAPGCERERFEAWWRTVQMRTFPKEYDIERLQDWGSIYKPKALEAWQARAALIAGDAVDAQRYRWLMDNCTLGIKQNGVGWSLNTSACVAPDCIKDVGAAIDAAMRKAK